MPDDICSLNISTHFTKRLLQPFSADVFLLNTVLFVLFCFVSVSSTTLLSSLSGTRVNLQDRFLPVSGTAGHVLLPVLTAQSKTRNRAAS